MNLSNSSEQDELKIFMEIGEIIETHVKSYFDVQVLKGMDPMVAQLQIGRAVLMMGVNLIGNAGQLDADKSIKIGQACLKRFQEEIEKSAKTK